MQRFSWLRGGYFFEVYPSWLNPQSSSSTHHRHCGHHRCADPDHGGDEHPEYQYLFHPGGQYRAQLGDPAESIPSGQMMLQSQDAVDFTGSVAQQYFTRLDQVEDPAFRTEVAARLHQRFEAAVRTIPEVDGYYFHFNEGLVHGEDGFWYQKIPQPDSLNNSPFPIPRKVPIPGPRKRTAGTTSPWTGFPRYGFLPTGTRKTVP